MPATFESFGLRILYPDNWTQLARADDEGPDGVTFELPCGGFVSIESQRDGELAEELIEEVADAIEEEYEDVEREQVEGQHRDERIVDFRFYYLDLLIISRLVIVEADHGVFVIQMQAESRDFDDNEMVFAAILKQVRDG